MNSLTKVTIGISSIGGIAGSSYVIYQQLSTNNIGKRLESEGYEILKKDSQEWEKILASYEATVRGNSNLKFDGLRDSQNELNIFKTKCEDALKKPYNSEKDYEKAAKWCTVPRGMKDMLKKHGFDALNTEDSKDATYEQVWNNKIDAHNKPNENQDKKFGNLVGVSSGTLSRDQNGRNALRKACKSLEAKKHNEQDFETELEKAKLWCAVKING